MDIETTTFSGNTLKRNIPAVKLGIVAVSRDCFPLVLSEQRLERVLASCRAKKIPVIATRQIVEKETDIPPALQELNKKGVNALVVYLGNFGPEGPIAILCQKFPGPVMVCGAAEESVDNLYDGRGDAYCGLLSASYNLKLRNITAYLPESPIGIPDEVAGMVESFIPVARILIGLKRLKIFSFGPRPQDFFTCEAPLKPLLDLGVEIMENSELDLYDNYQKAQGDPMVNIVQDEIKSEIGNISQDLVRKLAQLEVALTRVYERNLGISDYAVFANKCWPAFEHFFGFVPCYVNSRLNGKGIPVACEVDVYGGLSQYIGLAASQSPVTILDINNTVPPDMISGAGDSLKGYKPEDLFMGFHCGNTPRACLQACQLKHHPILHRLLESGKQPEITYGTLEGKLRAGKMTMIRLQAGPDGIMRAYLAEGEILDIDPRSFGGIGVIAVPGMRRFYRHVILAKGFPHHTAVTFTHIGKPVFEALKMLGIGDISVNLPVGTHYPGENPYS